MFERGERILRGPRIMTSSRVLSIAGIRPGISHSKRTGSPKRRCGFRGEWAAHLILGMAALLPAAALPAAPGVVAANAPSPSVSRPSFLIILADDLGLSDVGAFGGGDIETPHLNELARAGLRFSHFYATPVCSPSRAALLSGMDPHKAGLGNMAEDLAPNQQNQDSCVFRPK